MLIKHDLERIWFGCGNFGGIGSAPQLRHAGDSEEQALRLLDHARRVGLRRFVTANTYGGGASEIILGKYLAFALAVLGLDLVWGYTGLLSLCQALFFALGGYLMAMHLSLPEGGGNVRPEYHNIPQFMFFNSVHELPGFWRPFASFC